MPHGQQTVAIETNGRRGGVRDERTGRHTPRAGIDLGEPRLWSPVFRTRTRFWPCQRATPAAEGEAAILETIVEGADEALAMAGLKRNARWRLWMRDRSTPRPV